MVVTGSASLIGITVRKSTIIPAECNPQYRNGGPHTLGTSKPITFFLALPAATLLLFWPFYPLDMITERITT